MDSSDFFMIPLPGKDSIESKFDHQQKNMMKLLVIMMLVVTLSFSEIKHMNEFVGKKQRKIKSPKSL